MAGLADNYKGFLQEIRQTAEAAGRNPEEILLLAVSKTFPKEDIAEMYDAGCRDFGENRIPELQEKAAICTDRAALRELDACIAVLERGERVLPQSRSVTISACNLGSRLLLALPFEVAQKDGLRLEQEASALCGRPAHLVCYCGGYDGYLPHEHMGINYQDLATGYPPEARKMIWNAVLDCAADSVK